MAVPAIPSAEDPRPRLATEVFDHLARAALDQETDPAKAAERLWRLPEVAVYFVFNAVTDAERAEVDRHVHQLRLAAAEIINSRLDWTANRTALAEQLRRARRNYSLRAWRTEDAGALAALLGNENVWAMLPESYPGPIDSNLATNLIALSNAAPERHQVRAAWWQAAIVGQVRLQFNSSPYVDTAEISYWLGEPFWGRGIATDLVTLMTAQAFALRPGLQHIFARVVHGHGASMRVLEKAGYRRDPFMDRHAMKAGERLSLDVFSVCRPDYAFDAAAQIEARPPSLKAALGALMVGELSSIAGVLEKVS